MATDTESLLEFVNKHYDRLKTQAETDNIPGPSNENITDVIAQIDNLYKTINKGGASHDEIVKQLNELKTLYNGLSELDLTSYTRYIEANDSLNMIVDGFNEVEAGVGGEGEREGEGVDAGE